MPTTFYMNIFGEEAVSTMGAMFVNVHLETNLNEHFSVVFEHVKCNSFVFATLHSILVKHGFIIHIRN